MHENNPELTICSVCHSSENNELLGLNYAFTKDINKQSTWVWLVADNTPEGWAGTYNTDAFTIVPGFRMSEIEQTLPPELIPMKGGYHHAEALMSMIPRVTTRFLLVLDSDFYIVRPEWIKEVLDHMKKNNLSFFDVPWHPRWWHKWRYFPATHAMFVDLEKVDTQDIDIFAKPEERVDRYHPSVPNESPFLRALLTLPLPRTLKRSIEGRMRINSSRDNGYALYKRFAHNPAVAYECVMPVFLPYATLSWMVRWARLLFEALLPDRWSFIPRRSTYSEQRFQDLGYPSITDEGKAFEKAEEFLWRGVPYAFHLRGTRTLLGHKAETFAQQKAAVKKVLDKYRTLYEKNQL